MIHCLSDRELDAYRNGELNDPILLEHLHRCKRCQKKIADTRLLVSLISRKPNHAKVEHPADEEIVAFQYEALSTARSLELEKHFQSCNQCLAKLLSLRVESEKVISEMQTPKFDAVRSKFRPLDKWLSLGTLVVVSMESRQGLILYWVPQWVMSLLKSRFPLISYPQSVRDMTVDYQRMLRLLGIEDPFGKDTDSLIESLQSSSTPVCVEHGNLNITIDEKFVKQADTLHVRIVQKDSGTPLDGLMTVVLPPEGSPVPQ